MHGQFIWYELVSPDQSASKSFYPKFTGWSTMPFDNDYTMWASEGQPHAGLYALTDEMRAQGTPPNWLGYVEVTNVDKSATLAKSLGAQVIHGPLDIPGVGRFAIVQDPQGVVFGIYKSAIGTTGWDGTPAMGRFSWHELMTTDHNKAFEFYRKLFGWEKISEMDMGPGAGMYLMFGKGKAMYGGMYTATGDFLKMPPFWLYYIHVKDVPKAVASATKAGATLHRGPMDIPGGVIAILGDPQGAAFALHHQTAETAQSARSAGEPRKAGSDRSAGKPRKTGSPRKAARKKTVKKTVKKAPARKAKKATRKTAKRAKPKKAVKRRAPKRAVKRRSAKRK